MKTNLDKLFKTNAAYEKDGIWFMLNEATGFLLRPFKGTNPKVKAAMANYYKPYARQIELGTLDEDKQLEIMIKLFIDVCLVDWKGVEIDGKQVECKPDLALQFFKELPDLFDTLFNYAKDFNNYREDLGNF